MRPVALTVSALWWGGLTAFYLLRGAYIAVVLGFSGEGWLLAGPSAAALLLLSVSIFWFLWSYWQGQDWTRTFVIVGLMLKVMYMLYLGQLHHFAYNVRSLPFLIAAADFVLSVYIFYWLMTKDARRYFTFRAKTK
jgi:hypothetical protein